MCRTSNLFFFCVSKIYVYGYWERKKIRYMKAAQCCILFKNTYIHTHNQIYRKKVIYQNKVCCVCVCIKCIKKFFLVKLILLQYKCYVFSQKKKKLFSTVIACTNKRGKVTLKVHFSFLWNHTTDISFEVLCMYVLNVFYFFSCILLKYNAQRFLIVIEGEEGTNFTAVWHAACFFTSNSKFLTNEWKISKVQVCFYPRLCGLIET